MSDYDRYANTRYGAGLARSGVAVDQGLRAYMIGVYNYMTLGLGVTGLVAYAAFALGTVNAGNGRLALTDFGHAIYVSPLRWLIVLSPLALVFWLSARINTMSVSTARNAFIAFAALIGLSMSALLVVYTGASIRARVLRHLGRLRQLEPLRLHDPAQPVRDGFVHDDGRYWPHRREPAQRLFCCIAPGCSSASRSSAC